MDRARAAERAARAGAAVASESFRQEVEVETKAGKTDVVTQADRDAQREVIATLRESFPEDAVVGEEDEELKAVPESGEAWIVDPIDGTNNFVRDIPIWATSVAAVRDGAALGAANVMPAFGDVYTADDEGTYLNGERVTVSDATDPETFTVAPTLWWDFHERDQYGRACGAIVERFGDMRRFGCAQAVLSMVAAGQLEGAITNVAGSPWDTVAGSFMVEKAGGVVTDLDGDRWRHDSTGLVASNGEAHDELLAAANDIA